MQVFSTIPLETRTNPFCVIFVSHVLLSKKLEWKVLLRCNKTVEQNYCSDCWCILWFLNCFLTLITNVCYIKYLNRTLAQTVLGFPVTYDSDKRCCCLHWKMTNSWTKPHSRLFMTDMIFWNILNSKRWVCSEKENAFITI
jgi:hypothetical protein